MARAHSEEIRTPAHEWPRDAWGRTIFGNNSKPAGVGQHKDQATVIYVRSVREIWYRAALVLEFDRNRPHQLRMISELELIGVPG